MEDIISLPYIKTSINTSDFGIIMEVEEIFISH